MDKKGREETLGKEGYRSAKLFLWPFLFLEGGTVGAKAKTGIADINVLMS
jgi:hypothetical protein